uniref:type III-B CRISPR module RAMP protein Cmr1 n=1 Tax=uncultured Chloroflexus sp. TaxID=214040 RepID=UPI00260FD40D
MTLIIKTVTPLWTGGVQTGKIDRIHETGILGSLRWWYETVVRGLGGNVCDPSKGECRFDSEKYAKSNATDERQRLRDAGLCDVCQLFGATGWRRRFRLMIFDSTQSDASVSARVTANRTYTINNHLQTPTWYFPNNQNDKPRSGNFTLHIQPLDPTLKPEILAGLIQFIADWAAIGARPQMGFGVIELEKRVKTQPFYNHVVSLAGNATYPDLPSLQNIFFARISPKNGGTFSVQDTFNLKYDLRRLFANNQQVRHFIMGTVKDQRIAAKVKMSRPYNNGQEMRVWGWIPEQADVYQNNWNRNGVVQTIYNHLQQHYDLKVWREMN